MYVHVCVWQCFYSMHLNVCVVHYMFFCRVVYACVTVYVTRLLCVQDPEEQVKSFLETEPSLTEFSSQISHYSVRQPLLSSTVLYCICLPQNGDLTLLCTATITVLYFTLLHSKTKVFYQMHSITRPALTLCDKKTRHQKTTTHILW